MAGCLGKPRFDVHPIAGSSGSSDLISSPEPILTSNEFLQCRLLIFASHRSSTTAAGPFRRAYRNRYLFTPAWISAPPFPVSTHHRTSTPFLAVPTIRSGLHSSTQPERFSNCATDMPAPGASQTMRSFCYCLIHYRRARFAGSFIASTPRSSDASPGLASLLRGCPMLPCHPHCAHLKRAKPVPFSDLKSSE